MLYQSRHKQGKPLQGTIKSGEMYLSNSENTCNDYLMEAKLKKRITAYFRNNLDKEEETLDPKLKEQSIHAKIDKVVSCMEHVKNSVLNSFVELHDEDMIKHILQYRIRPKD